MQGAQQGGCALAVVGDVRADVVEVHPEADPGRLVAHSLNSGAQGGEDSVVLECLDVVLDGRVAVVGVHGVRRRAQRVEDHHVVPVFDEVVGDV